MKMTGSLIKVNYEQKQKGNLNLIVFTLNLMQNNKI